jgi:hypothetical protein
MTGIIALKKGENITSFFAVNKVRRIIGEKKCGHTGTLDPNATGVLPIAVGGATNSHHLTGMAADLTVGTKDKNRKLFVLAQQLGLPFTQLIDEYGYKWVHISYDPQDIRKQIIHTK